MTPLACTSYRRAGRHSRFAAPRLPIWGCGVPPPSRDSLRSSGSNAATVPTRHSGRLASLDIARGLALLGMIVVNVGPAEAESLLHRLYLLPYGRASVLFVVVAGVGMGFMLRSRRRDARRWPTVLWRAGLLFAGGLALQLLTDDVSVILPVYGALFALALLLQHLPRPGLLGCAATMTILGPVLFIAHVNLEGGTHPPYGLRMGHSAGELLHGLLLSGRYPLVTWCVPFIAGMWVARLDLRSTAVLDRLIVAGAAAAFGGFALSQLSLGLLDREADVGFARLLTGAAHGQMPLWLISSVGGAVFIIAVVQRLGPRVHRLLGPLAAAGQLALTLYVLHVVVLAVIRPEEGYSLPVGMTMSAVMIPAFMVLALAWRRFATTGPLEWLLRAPWLFPRRKQVESHPSASHPEGARPHDT